MSSTERRNLGQLLDRVAGGGTPDRSNPDYWDGDIPWATVKDLRDGIHELLETQEQITHSGLAASAARIIEPGIPILCTRMAVGRIATARFPVAINQDLKALYPVESVDPEYLVRAIESLRPLIEAYSIGSTVVGISLDQLRSFSVFLPDRREQETIVVVLSAIDKAIEQTEAIIAKQRRIKTGLMQDLLTRGIDEHGNIRSEETHAFKESPLGRIPAEWDVRPLSELAIIDRGKFTHRPRDDPRFYGGDLPFIQTGDVTSHIGRRLRTYSQTLNASGAKVSKEFPRSTIAITIAANIADTAILDIPMYFPDSVVGAIVLEPHSVRFVEMAIRIRKSALDALAPKSAQKNINLQTLRPLLLPAPVPEEQSRIAEIYESMEQRLLANKRSLSKLISEKAALMQDLLTGKVRVTPLLEVGA